MSLLLAIQFIVMYGGANWFTDQRSDVHRIYFDWETRIPFVAPMVWVYASVSPLMLLPVFYLDVRQLNRLAQQMAMAMLIATLVFLVYPGTTGYEPSAGSSWAIEMIRWVDRPYNVFPSLHIALSAIIMFHLGVAFGMRGRIVLVIWMGALIASVILTHQHHLADVAGGLLLAYACWRLMPSACAASSR